MNIFFSAVITDETQEMLAGLKKGPVVIKENLSHDEAVLIMAETNLRQRSFLRFKESLSVRSA
ncbi:MAG: hypothetical protein ACLTQG_30305 [Hungatella sp.]|uniref:hypothetical protein n=1 Tax=Hungatella sp. TaxID=2613924 RepID=UPI00399357EB